MSKILTKKWFKVNDLSCGQYSINKNIRFKTSRLDSYDYGDASIFVKGTIAVEGYDDKQRDKRLSFKNNGPTGPWEKINDDASEYNAVNNRTNN